MMEYFTSLMQMVIQKFSVRKNLFWFISQRSLSNCSGVGYEIVVGSSGDNDCHPDGLPAFQKPSTFGKIQADFQLLIWKGEKRWYPLVKSSHIFYYSNLFHSFIHCLVSTRRWRVGWILRQRGKSKNELQRWTIQRMLPCAESPDDMWESSGSIAELELWWRHHS